jgi:hypothetical protein
VKTPPPAVDDFDGDDEDPVGAAAEFLTAQLRDIIDTTDLAAPAKIAAEVLGRVPAVMVPAALAVTLPLWVQARLTNGYRDAPADDGRGAPGVGVSRWARVRSSSVWDRRLSTRVRVGPRPAQWKLLGECTGADLEFVEGHRRHLAEAMVARADEVGRLLAALRAAGAVVVRDLPDEVLGSVFEGPAAAA